MADFVVSLEITIPESLEDFSRSFYDHLDGLISERDGRVVAQIVVSGSTAYQATIDGLRRIEALKASVVKVDLDLVDATEIAARSDVTRQAVQKWATGGRHSAFPHPVGAPGGKRLWAWAEVVDWAHRKGKLADEPAGLLHDERVAVDSFLTQRRLRAQGLSLDLSSMLRRSSVKDAAGFDASDAYRGRRSGIGLPG